MVWGASGNIPSGQRSSAPLLKKYKCRVCEKFKGNESFSKKELNTWIWKRDQGTVLTEVSAKLRCRVCAGDQVNELQCMGPCGVIKDLQCFSKSSRANGGWKWCQECVLWKEAQEPGVIVQAAPAAELAPDEARPLAPEPATGYYSDPEAGEDSDDYGDWGYGASRVAAPVATSTIGGGAKTMTAINRQFIEEPIDVLSNLTLNKPASTISPGGYIPPHLRDKNGKPLQQASLKNGKNHDADIKSQSSASNPYETPSVASILQEWTPVDARRRQPPSTVFTAWDNTGRPHVRERVPSGTLSGSEQAPRSGLPRPAVPAQAGPLTNQNISPYNTVPAQLSGRGQPTASLRNNSKWAKPVGSRNANVYLRKQEPQQTVQHFESDDGM